MSDESQASHELGVFRGWRAEQDAQPVEQFSTPCLGGGVNRAFGMTSFSPGFHWHDQCTLVQRTDDRIEGAKVELHSRGKAALAHHLARELPKLDSMRFHALWQQCRTAKEKLLAEPDAFTPPGQAGAPLIPPARPFAKALYDNIQRLKLDVQVIAPFHGNRTTDVAELSKAATTSSN